MAATGGKQIKSVLIVGGGTAGWLAACHLAKKLNSKDPDGVQVTLVESPNIPTIGVGEGTVPAIRRSLQYLGISESEFIQACDVSFKQSIKFQDWLFNPDDRRHAYHHVFDYPVQNGCDLTPYYLMGLAGDDSYVNTVSVQGGLCDAGYGPKTMTHREYEGVVSYAYHLDAAKFAAFLTKHATEKLGVIHQLADVETVTLGDGGMIASIETPQLGTMTADLYVDCTGFRSLLLGDTVGVPFVDKSDILFVDTALAVQIPYGDEKAVPCHTIATAKEAGWIWDIGLLNRRGTGYVYSSAHTSHDAAEQVLRTYARETLGDQADDLTLRRIPMKVGYRQKFWEKNCVAIGLSQGFVEPLEATGLLIFDATARMIAEQFPATLEAMPALADRFNARVTHTWEKVIEFIKLHYVLSRRTDSDFWIDNRRPETIPAALQQNLEIWRHQPPTAYDFSSRLEVFNLENYLYVLYGMDFQTNMAPLKARYSMDQEAAATMQAIKGHRQQLAGQLLPHRELLMRAQQFGFQKI
ncbi:tryptophan halogenase [Kordiimonas sediminis]|uniref:Tryptophan halogenase n=1 Tax=Kordiimonas sediminis TaxID=1735581 RepID=A0A919AKB3_9PROT|nr:tryptophan halogenase family protein [Kordiimonas sediminis]GHF13784.1 tryptophan halogenase [Kordiimonas sediminis]